jgi:hypothetical protein
MYRRLVLLVALVALFATATEATSVIRGKRSRRYARRLALVEKLEKDQLRTYNEYGFPVHRLRVYAYGRIREHWTYYEHGREFVFDDESNLVETHRFWPEDRRERIERFPGY